MSPSIRPTFFRVVREALEAIIGVHAFTFYVRKGSGDSPFFLAVQRGLDSSFGVDHKTLQPAMLPEPIAGLVMAGQPFFHHGIAETAPRLFGQPVVASVPIQATSPSAADQATIGLINVHVFSPDHGNRTDFELMVMLSSQVAGAIHAMQLQVELGQYAHQLEQSGQNLRVSNKNLEQQMFHLRTLMLFSTQLHSAASLDELLVAIRDLLVNFIGVASYRLVYFEQDERHVTVGYADGIVPPAEPAGWLAQVEQVMASGEPSFETGLELTAAVPLLLTGQPQGVLLVETLLAHKAGLTGKDLEMLSLLAHQAAIALFTAYTRQRQAARRRDFYAMLAHDFRGPLANQQLALNLLLDPESEPLTELQNEFAVMVLNGNKQIAGLLDDFLAYSQVEAGGNAALLWPQPTWSPC
jgi:signal transduction histidine kinase